jgi:plastocyanin
MATPETKKDRKFWAGSIAALVLLYLVGIGVIVVTAVAVRGDGSSGGSGKSGGSSTIDVTLSEFKIEGNLTAPAGKVKFNIKNAGSMEHDLSVQGSVSPKIAAGKTGELEVDLKAGTYEVFCEIPGHKEGGMKATLTVTDGASGAAAATMPGASTAGSSNRNWAKMDADMLGTFKAYTDTLTIENGQVTKYTPNTKGVGNQPVQWRIAADGAKEMDLEASIVKWEVEPGKVVDAWAYNGMVPGPEMKLNVGDHVRIFFTNNLPVGQDIHFHGIDTPNNMDGVAPLTQELVPPNGGKFTYDFTVKREAVGMYHAHAHGVEGLPNGLLGVFQTGPTPIQTGITVGGRQIPKDLTLAVDMPMVLNDAGVIGLSLNGKSFPATAPVAMKQGEWGAVTYHNEGMMVHPMHMHGFPQLITAKDGMKLDHPYWADTILVGPGERYTALFQAEVKGVWVWHCHILNHAERESGMFGMVTAIAVG